MNSCGREMNAVVITITNPQKEYWPSHRFEPSTSCSQVFYATDGATGALLMTLQKNILENIVEQELRKAAHIRPKGLVNEMCLKLYPPILVTGTVLFRMGGL